MVAWASGAEFPHLGACGGRLWNRLVPVLEAASGGEPTIQVKEAVE
jgi:hypothetical protein